jgi:hypothetical protein
MICSGISQKEPAPRLPIVLLVAVAAVSPLGITMYLPSMPGMVQSVGVDLTTVQLTLSLYLATLGSTQGLFNKPRQVGQTANIGQAASGLTLFCDGSRLACSLLTLAGDRG